MRQGRPRRFVPDRCARLLLVALAPLSLSACKLIDQNTFAPAPEAKPPAAAAAASPAATATQDTRRPLVTIDFATPSPAYHGMLRYAVRAAEARDNAVRYDVVAVVPDAASVQEGQRDASGVMRAIMADGVPAARIQLGLHADPAATMRQVRVYVR